MATRQILGKKIQRRDHGMRRLFLSDYFKHDEVPETIGFFTNSLSDSLEYSLAIRHKHS